MAQSTYVNSPSFSPNHSAEQIDELPEWALARKGINLIINNNNNDAEALFLQNSDSLIMYAGYSFTVFMDALMTFEEEKLTKSITVLKDIEKKCTAQNGWFKSISQKVFGNSNGTGNSTSSVSSQQQSLADHLETQIILADSQVCLAILTFLQQDISGYFKGAWVLRKAWKIYQKTYKEIVTLYKEKIGELQLPDPIQCPTSPIRSFDESLNCEDSEMSSTTSNGYYPVHSNRIPSSHSFHSTTDKNTLRFAASQSSASSPSSSFSSAPPTARKMKKSSSVLFHSRNSKKNDTSSFGSTMLNLNLFSNSFQSLSNFTLPFSNIFSEQNQHNNLIDQKSIERLMGAVSFGHGLFQLGVSLLPPSLMRLVSILGFAASRQNGLACLMYARLGTDMRAPLASLALLWYHTIVRPFYAIDGVNVQAGVEAASMLIGESVTEFKDSALFLFFAGRTHRLDSNISEALTAFHKANDNANQREIKILSLHEIGWCYLIQLDYENAKQTFLYLKCASRWSKSFYGYLAIICIGASQDFTCYNMFEDIQTLRDSTRGRQLDEFLNRRFQCCPKDMESAKKYSAIYFKLLVFEMLYLWNALASCNRDDIDRIIKDCESIEASNLNEPRKGLKNLILGSCYCIQYDFEKALMNFRICLDKRINEPHNTDDAHISAFARFELGYILLQKDETKEEGKTLLQEIEKYSHYDFESRLNVRINFTLKHY